MTTQQHTPTPWGARATSAGQWLICREDGNGKTVAVVYTDERDAAFIVRACNTHDFLVAAIKRAAIMLPANAAKGVLLAVLRQVLGET